MKAVDSLLQKTAELGDSLLTDGGSIKSKYPFVFVPGLFGWGERDEINAVVPYWGLAGGAILPYLRKAGVECAAASVGPISGAWDRACELYAQLTGTTVDYGVAHSSQHRHERFGTSYTKPLVKNWDEENKINLLAHSFGGATVRLFLDILARGRQEEIDAALASGTEPSPFFRGGRGNWVHSLTAIAAPHNGTTAFDASPTGTGMIKAAFTACAKSLGITQLKGIYDFQLDRFGITRNPGETLIEAFSRVLDSPDIPREDTAFHDLKIDEAISLNEQLPLQPGIYYFSYPAVKTIMAILTHCHRPCLGMTPLLRPFASAIGAYYDKKTPGGFEIGREWAENDGLVNTVSAQYPTGKNGECLTQDGQPGFVFQDMEDCERVRPGVWNVMPAVSRDHLAMVGGLLNAPGFRTKLLYRQIIENIIATE